MKHTITTLLFIIISVHGTELLVELDNETHLYYNLSDLSEHWRIQSCPNITGKVDDPIMFLYLNEIIDAPLNSVIITTYYDNVGGFTFTWLSNSLGDQMIFNIDEHTWWSLKNQTDASLTIFKNSCIPIHQPPLVTIIILLILHILVVLISSYFYILLLYKHGFQSKHVISHVVLVCKIFMGFICMINVLLNTFIFVPFRVYVILALSYEPLSVASSFLLFFFWLRIIAHKRLTSVSSTFKLFTKAAIIASGFSVVLAVVNLIGNLSISNIIGFYFLALVFQCLDAICILVNAVGSTYVLYKIIEVQKEIPSMKKQLDSKKRYFILMTFFAVLLAMLDISNYVAMFTANGNAVLQDWLGFTLSVVYGLWSLSSVFVVKPQFKTKPKASTTETVPQYSLKRIEKNLPRL